MSNGSDTTCVITLEFTHPRRRADEITAALRIDPDRCWDKGAARNTPEGFPLAGRHSSSFWLATLFEGKPASEMGLAKTVASQLDILEPQQEFISSYCASGGYVQLSVYWDFASSLNDVLSADVLKRMADFNIAFMLSPIPSISP